MKTGIKRSPSATVYFLVCEMAASAASPTMPTFFARRDYTGPKKPAG